ncbi:hypothetical protein MYCTH_2307026 [Thermothelomyces thermophilus ATCC 42464]|uniref:Phytanoyl-CoA dioxygenase-like protein n=1 Tax=Thermothelomyces thermophilus (strain ATCC 42464 / BCRC 31852 / DSM 1799) TaxID=573729 RepID=G2QF47_THET4|nr:uncharacterized protein MYCTH_2307026 [Thermothelomyces thermophilus ATCC 42464]AEO59076.1 hypothetical protein MYCTH_2307026 [Thermothelomyces thermophilus ATCC 42464]
MTATPAADIIHDPSRPLLSALRAQGFVVLRSVLTPAELEELRGAAARLTATARAGGWPHVRTVGKQFPPWDSSLVPDRAGIWGVQHLLHPDLPVAPEDRAAFARLYFHERLLAVARELLSIPPSSEAAADADDDGEKLTMELFNMLVRPSGPGVSEDRPFALRWHRDDIPASASADEEMARLKRPGEPYVHAQWNLPLYDDDSLIVVPGSHARARTDAERAAGPYEDHIPGQVRVELAPGDVVFYDNNILHRGVYDVKKERMTLHGSVGHADGSRERARNVLQHGVGTWVDRCDFAVLSDPKQRKTAEAMRRRLVQLGRENEGRDVGYSLEG